MSLGFSPFNGVSSMSGLSQSKLKSSFSKRDLRKGDDDPKTMRAIDGYLAIKAYSLLNFADKKKQARGLFFLNGLLSEVFVRKIPVHKCPETV